MANKPLLIRGARQLLTLQGPDRIRRGAESRHLSIIEDGALLINDGLITNVGPTRRVENLAAARDAEVFDAHGRVVMPGLIDQSICLTPGPPRLNELESAADLYSGAPEDVSRNALELNRFLHQSPARTLEFQARRYLAQGMRHGTTTFGTRCGLGVDLATDQKCLRMLAGLSRVSPAIHRIYLGQAAPGALSGAQREQVISQQLPLLKDRFLIDSVDITALLPADLSSAETGLTAGRDWRLHYRTPELSTALHVTFAAQTGAHVLDGVRALASDALSALTGTTLLVGLVPADPAAIGAGRIGRALVDAGVPITLGSGFDSQRVRTLNMPYVLALACQYMGLNPAEAVTAATINAAHALGLAGSLGSLEYGKQADILILQVGDYREMAYFAAVNLVERVLKNGELVTSATRIGSGLGTPG